MFPISHTLAFSFGILAANELLSTLMNMAPRRAPDGGGLRNPVFPTVIEAQASTFNPALNFRSVSRGGFSALREKAANRPAILNPSIQN